MSRFTSKIKTFLVSEDGPTAVEYAVMLAMIVGVMIAAIVYVGSESQEISEDIVEGLDEALNK
jgi:pilus assembly protein Flp/PilA